MKVRTVVSWSYVENSGPVIINLFQAKKQRLQKKGVSEKASAYKKLE